MNLAEEKTQPQTIALRVLPALLFGTGHPYGKSFTGSGDEAGVRKVSRDDLTAMVRHVYPDTSSEGRSVRWRTVRKKLLLMEQTLDAFDISHTEILPAIAQYPLITKPI